MVQWLRMYLAMPGTCDPGQEAKIHVAAGATDSEPAARDLTTNESP